MEDAMARRKKPAEQPAEQPAEKPAAKKAERKQPSSTGKVVNVEADQSKWRVKLQQSRLKFDDDQKQIYLAEYAVHGRKGDAARAAGVCLETVRQHMNNDEEFVLAREEAFETYRDKYIGKVVGDLSLEGVLKETLDKEGNVIKIERVYPTPIQILEMKRLDPDYRDKGSLELTGMGGGVLRVEPDQTAEEVRVEAEAMNEVGRKFDEEEDRRKAAKKAALKKAGE
jgi:hypothetical protein